MTRRKHAQSPAGYPPGHFTALIRQHDWPPSFQPHDHTPARAVAAELVARAARWKAAAAGRGWAQGTLPMPNTPKNALPSWQVRRPS